MTDQPRDLAAEAAEISRIHDEGRYDQYGEHPAESIGTLLDYIAALSRELEEATQAGIDTAREISDTLTGRIDELEAENERLQSQLTALRRPVDQSAELSEICSRIDAGNGLWSDVPKLRAALDAAQREIARLSSPPEERAEIVESYRAAILKPKGASLYLAEQAGLIEDVGTLLGDCASWRNAHALVTAERDEARASVSKLMHDNGEYAKRHIDSLQRIERLEGALRSISTRIGGGAYSHDGMADLLIWAGKEASDALAAADGQQPYIVQGFWSPCRKYIASVHISNGRLVAVQDDNGDVWEPTGQAQDMAKVTP